MGRVKEPTMSTSILPMFNKVLILLCFFLILGACSKSSYHDIKDLDSNIQIQTSLENESSVMDYDIILTGKITGKNPIQQLQYRLNQGVWNPATGLEDFSIQATVIDGRNQIDIRAVDVTGASKEITLAIHKLWKSLASIPAAGSRVSLNSVLYYNNEFYVLGGQTGDLSATSLFYKYNPVSQTVTILPTLPQAAYSLNTGVYNNQIYSVSGGELYQGFEMSNAMDRVSVFNGSSWSTVSITQTESVYVYQTQTNVVKSIGRAYAGSAVLNGKMYIVGGIDNGFYGGVSLSQFYRGDILQYDIATGPNSWQLKIANSPYLYLISPVVIAHDNKIWIFGGIKTNYQQQVNYDPGYFSKNVYVYDPSTNYFSVIPNALKYLRSGMGCVKIQNKVYLFGGYGINHQGIYGYLDDAEAFDLNTKTSKNIHPIPVKLTSITSTTDGNSIYIFGGEGDGFKLSKIYQYNALADIWN